MAIRTRTSALFGSALVAFVILCAGLGAANPFGVIYRDSSGHAVGQSMKPIVDPTPTMRESPGVRDNGPEYDPTIVSNVVGPALSVAVILVLAGLTTYLIVYLLRHRPAAKRPRPDEPEIADRIEEFDDVALAESVRRSAQNTLSALADGELSAADAIIECWRQMAAAAAEHGIGRRATDTSTDLTERVLARTGIAPQTIGTLAELYRRAMFGGWSPGQGDVGRATQCLRAVVAELAGEPRA